MRKPRHFSPTSFDLWEKDKEAYYITYLSERRFDKDPQSIQMAIGSAFDFLVKEHLSLALPKTKLLASGSELKIKMSDQVEKHNLQEAALLGRDVFNAYEKSGALAALKQEIISDARFEFGVTGAFADGKLIAAAPEIKREEAIEINKGILPLLLNGRPDGYYKTRARFDSQFLDVIHDWKVNGWLSATKSPDPGFVSIHTIDGRVLGHHKDCYIKYVEGVKVNGAISCLPNAWLKQLSIYGWALGVPIGTTIIGSIDQIIGPASKARVAKHRFLIDGGFQRQLFDKITEAWEIVNSDHIFRDMTQEQSASRCAALETQIIEGPEDDAWMAELERER